ncbi:excitatory amino acid transporter 3-like isoform X1 [Xiphophorus couchianus]|uniref:excitatory amino acid transporter 3-like isoform X1 n=2 Tax=Xiphophorus couchianus TaxID=32473 RepID=UPI0010170861|nr:excitatory amino acid transporter 3-like isoform X1 [Xiphophorus couchianus]XP_027868101.1 excitatory amino acid transporter 3-like isoform X1 [Xiphophorus couchianus]XP_027868109.1 excitatory amino acid transporter 3-like isoform X1 [Xiphophorus couchianus]
MIILKESLFQGFTLMMIALGLGIGFLLRLMVSVTQDQMDWIKFPGDLFFNLLQLFAVPLIVTSVMAEVSGLNSRLPGRSAVFLTTYICGSTVLAVTLGMSLVLLVKPGMDHTTGKTTVNINMPSSSMHVIFMDLIRNVVPESFVQAFYEHYKTEIVQVKTNIPRHYLDPVMAQNGTETRLMGNYVPGANMVGLIASSFTIGIMLNKAGLKAKATVKFIKCLSIALKIIFNWILWYLPIGLLFLVVEYVLDVSDWTVIIKLIRLTGVIFLGLAIHSFLVLPLIFFVFTKQNPFLIFFQISKALFTSAILASSAATLPVTIQCCEANVKVNTKLCRLMLPMVSSINMNGMALYEVVAVLFIAQISDILLDVTQIITICLTCCISSFGAVGVPATGSATTILILTAVGLPAHNASLLLVFEWFLDHFTTIVNVLGDCFGVALINHLCQDEIVILDKSSREGMRSTRELELDLFCLEPEEEFIPSSSSGSILSM